MTVITSTDQLALFCNSLSQSPFVTVDTEFLRERTYYPKLCLIQLGSPDKNAVAIDPLAEHIDISPLFELLANKNITKVFHAARQDLEIFFNLTGTIVEPIFDTQVAAMVCGYGDSIGYDNLVYAVTGQRLDKSSQYTDWSHRPLSEKQLRYALGDVTYLCDVYLHLSAEIEMRERTTWLDEERSILANPATYQNNPYDSWRRIKIRSPKSKSLAVLRELAAWRENQAQQRDIPKTWILKDETLADMAAQAPRTKEQLKKIRNLSKDLADGRVGDMLIACINKALESPKETWPSVEKKEPLPPSIVATVDILKMLLRIQSSEHGVASKLIASQEDLEAIALGSDVNIPALNGWRREIFGEEALALKKGELAIGLQGDKITKYKISDLNSRSKT